VKRYLPNRRLVGGFNPFEKYARQIGNLPQVGVKINNISNHHLGEDRLPIIHFSGGYLKLRWAKLLGHPLPQGLSTALVSYTIVQNNNFKGAVWVGIRDDSQRCAKKTHVEKIHLRC